jgi:preprotein translocase subunit Sec63
MIIRDSALVFINLEFDLNVSKEHLVAYCIAKLSPKLNKYRILATCPKCHTVLNLALIHTMSSTHDVYKNKAYRGQHIYLSVSVQSLQLLLLLLLLAVIMLTGLVTSCVETAF